MSFTSWTFAVFLAVSVLVYWLLPGKFRWMWLLAASCLFYGWKEPLYLVYLLFAAGSTWLISLGMDRVSRKQKAHFSANELNKDEKKAYKARTARKKKALMALCLLLNVGLLALIKYSGLLPGRDSLWWLVMPLGISFYTFQTIGYVIDVYRETVDCQRNFFRYALYVSFFPQISQGPIGRYSVLAPQLFTPVSFDGSRVARGVMRMLWGFFKKLVIAGRLGIFVDAAYSDPHGGLTMALATLGYAFQLYADFAGYMDIIIGAGECFHIRLEENFQTPYLSRSIAEYWRRWHSTLGSWFRDYLYYPVLRSGWCGSLGKKLSKAGKKTLAKNLTTAIGLLCTWVLIGLWHGSTDNFLVHGLYHGTFVILAAVLGDFYGKVRTALKIREQSKAFHLFQVLRTFLIVNIGYVLFRSANMAQAADIFGKILIPGNFPADWQDLTKLLTDIALTAGDWIVTGLALLLVAFADLRQDALAARFQAMAPWQKTAVMAAVLLLIFVFGLYGIGFDAASFIYSQF